MYISDVLLVKEFHAETRKNAFLKASKWVASKILAYNNSEHLNVKYEKIKGSDSGIRLTVYVVDDEESIKQRHCDICNEAGSLFYMRTDKNKCSTCKMLPYRKRMEEKLCNIKTSMKGKINEK